MDSEERERGRKPEIFLRLWYHLEVLKLHQCKRRLLTEFSIIQEGSTPLYELQKGSKPLYRQLFYKDKNKSRRLLCSR